MTRSITAPRAATWALLALALALTGLVGVPQQAQGQSSAPYINLDRVDAGDPIAAGVGVSQMVFSERAEAAVLATDENFPDALSSSSLAAAKDAPVLFTHNMHLPTLTSRELRRILDPGSIVYLMGGPNAIDERVREQVEELGYRVQRVQGPTRLETAVAAARLSGLPEDRSVIIARAFGPPGQDRVTGWVDSVSCGAFAARTGTPVLLTETGHLSTSTAEGLRELGAQKAIVCGGDGAVSDTVLDQLRAANVTPRRISGPTRVETALEAARHLFGYEHARGREFILVNGYGENFGFGLAATPLAAQRNAPILLVGQSEPTGCGTAGQPSAPTLCHLETAGNDTAHLYVIGSTAQVGQAVADAAAAAAGGERAVPPATPRSVTAQNYGSDGTYPGDDGTRLVVRWSPVADPQGTVAGYNVYVGTSSANQRQGGSPTVAGVNAREYIITGLTPDTEYRVAVTAVDRFGQESPKSDERRATPVDDDPTPVRGFQASAGDSQVTLEWASNDEPDVIRYHLDRAEYGSNFPLPGSSCDWGDAERYTINGRQNTGYVDGDADNDQEYCYRIRAVDAAGNTSEWVASDRVTPRPGAPSVTVTSPTSDDTLRHSSVWPITWEVAYTGGNNSDLRVRIQLSQDGGETYSTIADNRPHGSNAAEGRFDWLVQPDPPAAIDDARIRVTVSEQGVSPRVASHSTQDFDLSPRPRQVAGVAANPTGSAVRVSWDANPELAVTGYRVARKVVQPPSSQMNTAEACQAPGGYSEIGRTSGRTATTFDDGDVTANSTLSQYRYCYQVQALREGAGGGRQGETASGAQASATVPAVAAPSISLRAPSNNETILTGRAYDIRYTVTVPSGGQVDRVVLEYCVNYSSGLTGSSCNSGWQQIASIPTSSGGDRTHRWNVPNINQADNQTGAVRAQVYATSGGSASDSDISTGIRFR